MNKIVIYEQSNFQGRSKEFTSDIPNLNAKDFNYSISSVKVYGKPWVAFSDCFFKGDECILEEGEHAHVQAKNMISSMKLANDDLSNPQITLYEHPNYQGRSFILTAETCLCDVGFNDTASSHKVQRGVWILYKHVNRGGAQVVARAGRDVPQYTKLNKQVSHVRPVTPGRIEKLNYAKSYCF